MTELDHVGCRLDATDPARHSRLLDMLEAMVDDRRAASGGTGGRDPLVVVVIDGLTGFLDTARAGVGEPNAERLARILRDGPAVGVAAAVAMAGPTDLPRSLQSTFRRHFVMELADPGDYLAAGLRVRNLPRFRPGRVLLAPDGQVGQVLRRQEVAAPVPGPRPPSVDELPESIPAGDLHVAVELEPHLRIPIGLDDRTRRPAWLPLRRGEHAVIAGPAGSGRTTALRLIARQLRTADPGLVLVGIAAGEAEHRFDGLGFDALGTAAGLAEVLAAAREDDRRWVILVDDAEQVGDDHGRLDALAAGGRPGLAFVAGLRASAMRQAFGHWTRHLRASGVGVLLNPDNDVDGEVLGVRLPRTERLHPVPGRGYLVIGGEVRPVQLAH